MSEHLVERIGVLVLAWLITVMIIAVCYVAWSGLWVAAVLLPPLIGLEAILWVAFKNPC